MNAAYGPLKNKSVEGILPRANLIYAVVKVPSILNGINPSDMIYRSGYHNGNINFFGKDAFSLSRLSRQKSISMAVFMDTDG